MRMKNPPHPVAANLKELGLSVAEAPKAIGVTRQQLHNIMNGRSAATPEMAVRLFRLAPTLLNSRGCHHGRSWAFVIMMEWQHAQEDRVFIGKMVF